MNNDLINELYSKIDNQEKIIVDLQKNNSGITLEEHVRVLNAYQELQNKNKELIQKIKFNEKSRRKMQQSLMKKIEKQKEVIDKVKELVIDNIEETTYEYIGSNKVKVLLELRMDNDSVNELLDILEDKEVSE